MADSTGGRSAMFQCESGYELLSAHYSQLARGKGTFFSFNPVFL